MKSSLSRILGLDKKSRLGELDGIRALAVMMVFFYHVWGASGDPALIVSGQQFTFLLATGHLGVDLFYLLSGFWLFLPFGKG